MQPFIERMLRKCVHTTEDDEFHPGTGDGYIHTAEVAEEAYLSLIIATYEGEDDDITLLSLETIHGIDRDKVAERLEELALPYESAQQLHLSTIWRDDAHVDTLIEDALLSYAREIQFEMLEG